MPFYAAGEGAREGVVCLYVAESIFVEGKVGLAELVVRFIEGERVVPGGYVERRW